ncbi:MAG: diguanylate cyclase [Actinomycetota bacterium]
MATPESSPTFLRAVLDHAPMPLVVVDEAGSVIYGNVAMAELTGRSLEEARGTNMLLQVHPDDQEWVTSAFVDLVDAGSGVAHFGEGSAWATIYCRMIDGVGQTVPIAVTGRGGVLDPVVGGIIYDVRPAWEHALFGQILEGLANGAPVGQLLGLIAAMIASPPLELDAAVVRGSERGGGAAVVASTSPTLTAALDTTAAEAPWSLADAGPTNHLAADLGDDTPFADAGYHRMWHMHVGDGRPEHTFVVGTKTDDASQAGPVSRLHQARQLAAIVLQRARADAELERAALSDPLTGVLNRLGLIDAAATRRADAGARAVVYVDLDGFKPVNDAHGHSLGDRVLRVVADRIRAAVRSEDLVGRVGGDEFVIVPAPTSELASAQAIAEATGHRLVEVLGRPITVDHLVVTVGASVGVAVAEGAIPLDELVARADRAMYDAKRAGGGAVRVAG